MATNRAASAQVQGAMFQHVMLTVLGCQWCPQSTTPGICGRARLDMATKGTSFHYALLVYATLVMLSLSHWDYSRQLYQDHTTVCKTCAYGVLGGAKLQVGLVRVAINSGCHAVPLLCIIIFWSQQLAADYVHCVQPDPCVLHLTIYRNEFRSSHTAVQLGRSMLQPKAQSIRAQVCNHMCMSNSPLLQRL